MPSYAGNVPFDPHISVPAPDIAKAGNYAEMLYNMGRNFGQDYRAGQEFQYQQRQRNLFANGLPTDASGNVDYNRAMQMAVQAGGAPALSDDRIRFMMQQNYQPPAWDGSGAGGGGSPPIRTAPSSTSGPVNIDPARFSRPATSDGNPYGVDPEYVTALKGLEGYRSQAYPDGRQTSIGYGTRAQYPGERIDPQEADRRLRLEVNQAAGLVDGLGIDMSPAQRNALIDLTYNAGPGWMQGPIGQAVRNGDWRGAAQMISQYHTTSQGRQMGGLQSRRAQEAQWIAGGGVNPDGVSGGGGPPGSSPSAPAGAPSTAAGVAGTGPAPLPSGVPGGGGPPPAPPSGPSGMPGGASGPGGPTPIASAPPPPSLPPGAAPPTGGFAPGGAPVAGGGGGVGPGTPAPPTGGFAPGAPLPGGGAATAVTPASRYSPEQMMANADALAAQANRLRQQEYYDNTNRSRIGLPARTEMSTAAGKLDEQAQAWRTRALDYSAPTDLQKNAASVGMTPLQYQGAQRGVETAAERGVPTPTEMEARRAGMTVPQYEAAKTQATTQATQEATRYNKMDEFIQAGNTSAAQSDNDMQAMRGLLNDPSLFTGPGHELVETGRKVLANVGLGREDAALANDALKKVTSRALQSQMDMMRDAAGEAGGSAGRIMLAQVNIMQNAAQNPDMSRPGLTYLTELMERANRQTHDVSELARAYRQAHGRLDPGFDGEVANYYATHPMLTPQEITNHRLLASPQVPQTLVHGTDPRTGAPLVSASEIANWAHTHGIERGASLRIPGATPQYVRAP